MTRDMKQAPRKGWIVMHLRDGRTLVGCYNEQLAGWAEVRTNNPTAISVQNIEGWELYKGPRKQAPTADNSKRPPKPIQVIGRERALAAIEARNAAPPRRKIRKPIQVVGGRKREE